MQKFLVTFAAIFGLVVPSMSFAQESDEVTIDDEIVTPPKKQKDYLIYLDANLATAQFSDTDGRRTATSDSTINSYFRAGAKYKYFGAEAEYGTGLSEIKEDGIALGLKSSTSFFGILRYPENNYDFFVRAGYHSSDFDISGPVFDPATGQTVTAEDTISSDGFVAGIGGTYYFAENFGARLDITGYNTRDFVDAGYVVASLGGTVKF